MADLRAVEDGYRIIHSVLKYLKSKQFRVPIQSFIDTYCVIFSPVDIGDDAEEKQKIFAEYKKVVLE